MLGIVLADFPSNLMGAQGGQRARKINPAKAPPQARLAANLMSLLKRRPHYMNHCSELILERMRQMS